MSNKRYTQRRRNGGLGRVLLLLGIAVVVLVVAIALTGGKPTATPNSSSTSGSSSVSALPPASPPKDSSVSVDTPASSTSQSTSQSSSEPVASEPSPSSVSEPASGEAKDKYYEEAKPILVNPTNKVPEDWSPELVAVADSYKLEARAAAAYKDMQAQAYADGAVLWVVSAYRSYDKQLSNFNSKIKEYENQGYTATEAYAATAKLIAIPGTSEHSLGYAVDVNSLYTSFEQTKEFEWLSKHCAEYGFILRYPKDKVDITQISYEPWHYRYVGSNHARIIMDKGICLEEYLSGDY